MTPKSKFFTLIILALASSVLLLPVHASASTSVPVNGTFTDSLGSTGQFVGSFTPQTFGVQGGKLVAVGTLVGNMTDSTGALLGTITNANTAIPVSATGTCAILNLSSRANSPEPAWLGC